MDTIGWQDLKVDVTQHNVTEVCACAYGDVICVWCLFCVYVCVCVCVRACACLCVIALSSRI